MSNSFSYSQLKNQYSVSKSQVHSDRKYNWTKSTTWAHSETCQPQVWLDSDSFKIRDLILQGISAINAQIKVLLASYTTPKNRSHYIFLTIFSYMYYFVFKLFIIEYSISINILISILFIFMDDHVGSPVTMLRVPSEFHIIRTRNGCTRIVLFWHWK